MRAGAAEGKGGLSGSSDEAGADPVCWLCVCVCVCARVAASACSLSLATRTRANGPEEVRAGGAEASESRGSQCQSGG